MATEPSARTLSTNLPFSPVNRIWKWGEEAHVHWYMGVEVIGDTCKTEPPWTWHSLGPVVVSGETASP